MIKVLVVDDDPIKTNKISKVITECGLSIDIKYSDNSASAMEQILINSSFDLMILDLNLPRRVGEDARKTAGRTLLKEIIRRPSINKPRHIIGLTSYDSIKEEDEGLFNKEGWLICTYSAKLSDWEETISNKLQYLNNTDKLRIEIMNKVLFVASSPEDQDALNAGKEQRIIQEQLDSATFREKFEFISKTGAKFETLTKELLKNNISVVHFTGHGSNKELAMEMDDGLTHLVPSRAIISLFEKFTGSIKCVILSSCYSSNLAKAISHYNLHVVSMGDAVGVEEAIMFSKGFYQALYEDKRLDLCYDLGLIHYQANAKESEDFIPELWLKGKRIR